MTERRRLIRRNETYQAGDDIELDSPAPDMIQPAEADQHGDPEHEGAPGGAAPETETIP
jgi:hypothetical protein